MWVRPLVEHTMCAFELCLFRIATEAYSFASVIVGRRSIG
jgi:hypothetical protein